MSQITTHVLNTSLGKPAANIEIALQEMGKTGKWEDISRGKTNEDGRISNLLAHGIILSPGRYRMLFYTEPYFQALGIKSFYPEVSVVFTTVDNSHHHIPLLLNPFGYSTYRGS